MKFFSESGGKNGAGLRFRFLPSAKKKKASAIGASRSCREKNGKTVLPMYSDFFSHTTGRMMVTANQYDLLYQEIQSVIAACSPKEEILLNVYVDSETVTDLDMEGLTVGFRRFISANRRRMTQELKKGLQGRFCSFSPALS